MVNDREKCLGKCKGNKHPTLETHFHKKLKDFFDPQNEKFYKLVGHWFNWQ